jgi:hypothetical protein
MNDPVWFPWAVRVGSLALVFVICWFVWKLTKLHSKGDDLMKKASPAAAQAPRPSYTYEQMMQDLSDERLSIDEIFERCQGQFPKELADAIDGKPASPPVLTQSREAARLSWFAQVAQGVPNYKVVPPPPQPPPTVTVKGWVVLCSCRKGMVGLDTNPMYGPGPRYSPGVSCQACRDRGFMIITGG